MSATLRTQGRSPLDILCLEASRSLQGKDGPDRAQGARKDAVTVVRVAHFGGEANLAMRHLYLRNTLCLASLILLCCASAGAQVVRPRRPSEPVIKPPEKPYETAPTSAQREAIEEPLITKVRVSLIGPSVKIDFSTFPNTVPLVELSRAQPLVGQDARWVFPQGSWSVTRPAGGDKAKGEYSVDMNQELEPDTTYHYIISARNDNGPNARRTQIIGKLTSRPAQPRTFEVRYRGFICQEKTDGPGSDEIYAIVTVSPVGRPDKERADDAEDRDRNGTASSDRYETGRVASNVNIRTKEEVAKATKKSGAAHVHPHVIIEDVESGDVHGDPGRELYMGPGRDLLLTVVLMEHDAGDPEEIKNQVQTAVAAALVGVVANVELSLLSGPDLARALYSISAAVAGWLSTGDDVIGVANRMIKEEELKNMVGQGPATEKGISYSFFTEHRGHGGVYRVYFDVLEK